MMRNPPVARVFDSKYPFSQLAKSALEDSQLRSNLNHATSTIREKRRRVVEEVSDWEDLRQAGAIIKDHSLRNLDEIAEQFEHNVKANGGKVHWARDAGEANRIITDLVLSVGASSVVKIKSMTTAEIELNDALEEAGIACHETDLAELIVQLGDDLPSHILVPAIHKNRAQIRKIFIDNMGTSRSGVPPDLSDDPRELAAAARNYLRDRFLNATVAISGANFAVAETGSIAIVESEGNGRMCLTLPETLISVVGLDKLVPDWSALGVFFQLLPRSSTGERMNPYTSIFTGSHPGDGPKNVHVVLLDNGRTNVLANPLGREVLRCIRCSACLNVCPVYQRTGGHSYGSPYPGPIGAVLVPQLTRREWTPLEKSLPFASTLCGACYEVCPVKINIPRVLINLRSDIVDEARARRPFGPELLGMKALALVFRSTRLFETALSVVSHLALFLGRKRIRSAPPPLNRWTSARDIPLPSAPVLRAMISDETEISRNMGIGSVLPVGRPRLMLPWIFFRRAIGRSRWGGLQAMESVQARDSVLVSVRSALGDIDSGASKAATAAYKAPGGLGIAQKTEQLADRLSEYRATVVETTDSLLSRVISEILSREGSRSLVIAEDLPRQWLEETRCELLIDAGNLSAGELDQVDSMLSGCALAISETGTIVLDSGKFQGRRVLSLLPDHHIVVVFPDQIVEGVVEAVALLDPRAPQTWISGPSATSDIELERVEGVHGPRRLDVILVTRESGPLSS